MKRPSHRDLPQVVIAGVLNESGHAVALFQIDDATVLRNVQGASFSQLQRDEARAEDPERWDGMS